MSAKIQITDRAVPSIKSIPLVDWSMILIHGLAKKSVTYAKYDVFIDFLADRRAYATVL